MKCQGFGHVTKNCFKIPKSVKCADSHETSECKKNKSTDVAQCAICGGNHTSSHLQCKIYLTANTVNTRFPRRPENVNHPTKSFSPMSNNNTTDGINALSSSQARSQGNQENTYTYSHVTKGDSHLHLE